MTLQRELQIQMDVVANTVNPSTWEEEASEFLNSRPA